LVREIELLGDAQVTLLSDRRKFAPYGLDGGLPGAKGQTILVTNGAEQSLPGKCNLQVNAGDVIRIATPGGGGWGTK
jgi:N-methylhydantoinase B